MTTTPTTAASVYQQLRTHLAELKLADAAEALPAVLDQAIRDARRKGLERARSNRIATRRKLRHTTHRKTPTDVVN